MTGNDLENSLFIGNEAVSFFCSSCSSDNPAADKSPVEQCFSRILKELIADRTDLIYAKEILKQHTTNTVSLQDFSLRNRRSSDKIYHDFTGLKRFNQNRITLKQE